MEGAGRTGAVVGMPGVTTDSRAGFSLPTGTVAFLGEVVPCGCRVVRRLLEDRLGGRHVEVCGGRVVLTRGECPMSRRQRRRTVAVTEDHGKDEP